MISSNQSRINQLKESGFLHLKNVIPVDAFSNLMEEYYNVLLTLIPTWVLKGYVESDFKTSGNLLDDLLVICENPKFPRSLLGHFDITLPHMPFTALKAESPIHIGQAVLDLMRSDKLLNELESIIGPEICASPNQHSRMKLPSRMTEGRFKGQKGETIYSRTAWHQDMHTQIPQSEDTELLTVWIPTHDVDESMGCLVVSPGWHKDKDLLPWPIPADTIDKLEECAVSLPCKAGDVIILDRRLPHSALPNQTSRLRWSFDFRFFPRGQASDRPWFPDIVVRSRREPAKEVTDHKIWRSKWDKALRNLIESNDLLPGRRDFCLLVANAMIQNWEEGKYPVFSD